MPTTQTTLLHFALRAEAQAFIEKLKLEPIPRTARSYALFGNARYIALIGGIGAEATQTSLEHFFTADPLARQMTKACNIGIVGCNDVRVAIGTLFVFDPYEPPSLPPIVSVQTPQSASDTPTTTLYDMECDAFVRTLRRCLPHTRLTVCKVVSDHLDDARPSKAFVKELMLQHYQTIREVLDAR